jgi:uncharacterized protein YndB with AHSA1/START domain
MTVKNNVDAKGREIITSRLLNAPRELVFEVFTDPKHTINWWGPDGFTITNQEMSLKPGGAWRFMMHGPNGMNFLNKIVFIQIEPPERLVYKHGGEEDSAIEDFFVTVTFEKVGEKTNLTMTGLFSSAEERARVVKEFGAIEGGIQTMNRLEAYLIKL